MNTFNMKTPLATLVTLCAAFSAVQAQADAGYGSSSAEGLSNYISVGVTAASERQGHPSPAENRELVIPACTTEPKSALPDCRDPTVQHQTITVFLLSPQLRSHTAVWALLILPK